jgi:hypothetical protein
MPASIPSMVAKTSCKGRAVRRAAGPVVARIHSRGAHGQQQAADGGPAVEAPAPPFTRHAHIHTRRRGRLAGCWSPQAKVPFDQESPYEVRGARGGKVDQSPHALAPLHVHVHLSSPSTASSRTPHARPAQPAWLCSLAAMSAALPRSAKCCVSAALVAPPATPAQRARATWPVCACPCAVLHRPARKH